MVVWDVKYVVKMVVAMPKIKRPSRNDILTASESLISRPKTGIGACLLLKFYHRQNSEAKKATGFLPKDQSKLAPRALDYFSLDDIEGLDKVETEEAEGDFDGRTPGSRWQPSTTK